ncbi:MAG: hypothetical protein CMF90_08240, partial [Candidatus Marinimicrobia bacterium]|nr:hypothetical protein [Candidatus Neomarinimicrobiota bacterium]
RLLQSSAGKSAVLLTLPTIMSACQEAKKNQLASSKFQTLTSVDATELDAIAERILPATNSPGARDAGVIYFFDNVLRDRAEALNILKNGLLELQKNTTSEFNSPFFYSLPPADQDQLLARIENTEFFATARYLTIAGMFALPEYGGNKNLVGDELIGFEGRLGWTVPFGYYDADYIEKGE